MAQNIILGFLAVLILGAYSEESVKRSIELCQNKSPTRHLIPSSPNNYQMKDLLHSTTLEDEIRNKNSNDEHTADNILGIISILIIWVWNSNCSIIHSYFIKY